jgi:cytochrome b pre-mRNA-processing protein 3
MKRVGEAFYGRAQAYEKALAEQSDAALFESVERNVYGGGGGDAARRLVVYIRRIMAELDRQTVTAIAAGSLGLPDPALDASSKGPTTND